MGAANARYAYQRALPETALSMRALYAPGSARATIVHCAVLFSGQNDRVGRGRVRRVTPVNPMLRMADKARRCLKFGPLGT